MPNLTGSRLFCREVHLTLGVPDISTLLVDADFATADNNGLKVDGLDIDFSIEKSLKATEANKCELSVFNMTESHRQALGGAKALTVRLEAGYQGATQLLYLGNVRSAFSERVGTGMADFVTKISSEDTKARLTAVGKSQKLVPGQAAVQIPLGPRTTVEAAIQALAAALGKNANGKAVQAKVDTSNLGDVGSLTINGSAVLGDAWQRLTDICRSAGLEWSVQDGVVQLLNVGKALSTTDAVYISPDTGLVESPSVDSQGYVQAKTLLIKGIAPGALVKFIGPGDPSGLAPCLFVQGGYRVDKCRYDGSTYKKEFYVEMTCVKY